MEELFTPNLGLMVWTVLTFLLLVAVLAKFGWGPLVAALEAREARLRQEREAAERARLEAQRLQAQLETQLAAIDARARETLDRAAKEVEALRTQGEAQARSQAQRLMEKTRAELEEERRRVVAQLRGEVAGLAVMAAEKVVRKAIDEQIRKSSLEQFLQELERKP